MMGMSLEAWLPAVTRPGGVWPGSEEPWRMSPVKGAPPQDLSPLGVFGGVGRVVGQKVPWCGGEAAALLSC